MRCSVTRSRCRRKEAFLTIPVNPDFLREYKTDVWKGLSLRELSGFIAGVLASGILFAVFWRGFRIPPRPAVFLSLPFMVPAVFWGFFYYQGYLTAGQLFRAMLFRRKTHVLTYATYEYVPSGKIFSMKRAHPPAGREGRFLKHHKPHISKEENHEKKRTTQPVKKDS